MEETTNLQKLDDSVNDATPDSMYIYEGQDFSQVWKFFLKHP